MDNQNNQNIPIENIVAESFSQYAKYIIQDRALPDIRDGLKPVQRRIIYAMSELNLLHNLPHKKSARTVGEVIGKYHPHGDSSIYDAMVRLSQEWKNNICLLDMHGNKGSIDGDGPAAMRYTECRLSAYGEIIVNSLKKNTVDFIPNFDGSEHEPIVLPAIYPNLLINGANGIAAGYATNIPPFNPCEVVDAIICKIDSPNCSIDKILTIMPGPDFPTGGIISNLDGIKCGYKTGKGKIFIAGAMKKINDKEICITSIPFETNKSEIIKQIEQAKEKIDALKIVEVRDESDANGVNIIIETKQNSDFDFIRNYLYKNTKLQTNFNFNMIAIKNRKPILLDILTFIQSFIDHAEQIILKSAEYDLNKVNTRKEIVTGLIKAILIIDDVVTNIRKAKDKENAIDNLIQKFNFTTKQAEAIVQLRLYRLTNSDVVTLKEELVSLNNQLIILQNLVDSKNARLLELKNKLREFKKNYPITRKCKLSHKNNEIKIDELDLIDDKNNVYTFTNHGYIKSFSNKVFLANEQNDFFLKSNDLIVNQYIANMRDKTLIFASSGDYISITNNKIPECKFKDIGIHINNIVNSSLEGKIIQAINSDYKITINKTQIVICSKFGYIRRCELAEFINKKNTISKYAKLDIGDTIVAIFKVDNDQQKIVICSNNGYINSYLINQIPLVSKTAKGVKAMGLKENDKIASCFLLTPSITQVVMVTNYQLRRFDLSFIPFGNRSNLGKSINYFITSNPKINVIKILPICKNMTIIVINTQDQKEYMKTSDINYIEYNSKINCGTNQIIDANISFWCKDKM